MHYIAETGEFVADEACFVILTLELNPLENAVVFEHRAGLKVIGKVVDLLLIAQHPHEVVLAGADPVRLAGVHQLVGSALEPAPLLVELVCDVVKHFHQARQREVGLDFVLDLLAQWFVLLLIQTDVHADAQDRSETVYLSPVRLAVRLGRTAAFIVEGLIQILKHPLQRHNVQFVQQVQTAQRYIGASYVGFTVHLYSEGPIVVLEQHYSSLETFPQLLQFGQRFDTVRNLQIVNAHLKRAELHRVSIGSHKL